MMARISNEMATFAMPFLLKGVDRELAAGSYRVVTDEELIEELSFPAYRRLSTWRWSLLILWTSKRRRTAIER
jgi:hypothetical protein